MRVSLNAVSSEALVVGNVIGQLLKLTKKKTGTFMERLGITMKLIS
jgi:hypothetical protein